MRVFSTVQIAVDQMLPARLGAGGDRFALDLGRRIGAQSADPRASADQRERHHHRRDHRVSSFGDANAVKLPENVAKHRFNVSATLCARCCKRERNFRAAPGEP